MKLDAVSSTRCHWNLCGRAGSHYFLTHVSICRRCFPPHFARPATFSTFSISFTQLAGRNFQKEDAAATPYHSQNRRKRRWIVNDRIAAGTETALNAFIKAKALEDPAELNSSSSYSSPLPSSSYHTHRLNIIYDTNILHIFDLQKRKVK
jgi:hypothetical protein